VAIGTSIVTFAALWVLRYVLRRSLRTISRRTTNNLDDVATEAVLAIRSWILIGIAVGVGAQNLALPTRVRFLIEHVTIVLILVQMGISGAAAIRGHVTAYGRRQLQSDAASVTTVRAVGFLGIFVLWAVLALMALDNFGIEITALVAGLGIGGIAVALAVQNILGDLFASLSIVLDKPFVDGDFIVVGDMAGTVEQVGLKTTRVRSLSGEQLVLSNSDLLQSRIRNFKRMQERRIVMAVGVVYDTSADDLAIIPGMMREVIEAQEDVRFDRAHLKGLAASSIDFEAVYYVRSPEYIVYMDRQQAITLELIRRFQAAGLEFAFPTQTLHIVRPPAVPAESPLSDKV
jgi:small-conductance mechanosensitive channel